MGVTNRGGCASSQSSGSPLYLDNLKLPKGTALVGNRALYLCTVEIKGSACVTPNPSVTPLCRPHFRLRARRLCTGLTSDSGCRGSVCRPGFVYRFREDLEVFVYVWLHKRTKCSGGCGVGRIDRRGCGKLLDQGGRQIYHNASSNKILISQPHALGSNTSHLNF
jgi:hypothetical protein